MPPNTPPNRKGSNMTDQRTALLGKRALGLILVGADPPKPSDLGGLHGSTGCMGPAPPPPPKRQAKYDPPICSFQIPKRGRT